MKTMVGIVMKTKMDKTANVLVERIKIHPIYRKRFKIKKKYHVHDEIGVKNGDRVRIEGCRPISRTKKWKVIEVIK